MAPAVIQKKTVFITGCSTGSIGAAMTKVFLAHDFHVFAAVRSFSKAQELSELSNVDVIELDVTLPQTISQCKHMVTERTGGNLDILVSISLSLCIKDSRILPSHAFHAFQSVLYFRFRNTCLTITRSTAPGSRVSVHFLIQILPWQSSYTISTSGALLPSFRSLSLL